MGNPWLAVPCILLLFGLPFEWRRMLDEDKNRLRVFASVGAMIMVPTIVVLFYFWGKANLNFTVRYFLPFSVFVVLASLASIGFLLQHRHFRLFCAVGLAAASIAWAYPRTTNAGLLSDLAYAHKIRVVLDELRGTKFECDGLIIADRGLVFTIHGFSSITALELERPDVAAMVRGMRVVDLSESLFSSDDVLRSKLTAFANGKCSRELRDIDFGLTSANRRLQ
jgi:hypothetical protein